MSFDGKVKALIASKGGEAPLAHVASALSSADLTFGNLESNLSSRSPADVSNGGGVRGDPRAVAGLAAAGFDAVSLANNHAFDFGAHSLADTIARLEAAGVGHAGAGANREAAWSATSMRSGDASVALLAFSFVAPASSIAQTNRAGVASARVDAAQLSQAIRDARAANDYVVVMFHWGISGNDAPTAEQIDGAHAAIDSGASLVIGSHPHVIQGIERYKTGLIAYSLGDFVFDHASKKTGESFILNAALGPDGVVDATAVPVYLDSHGRPDIVSGTEAVSILDRLKSISAPLGGSVAVDGFVGRIVP
jgi:poly-gamma-glutamate synthesis protein (capsule biosynthesis protein)